MNAHDNLLIDLDERGVATLTLNRPQKRNAFDDTLIARLSTELRRLEAEPDVRVVVLTGAGATFCSGADIEWMRTVAGYSEAENLSDALRLAELLAILNGLSKPTLARVNGDAFGGGIGLIACCDIAITHTKTRFAFTEVYLGLVPAVISPYVVAAMGTRQARRFFLTGESMTAKQARRARLIHEIVKPDKLDAAIEDQVTMLLKGGSEAQREAKALVATIAPHSYRDMQHWTAELIARLRASPEGQEGLRAFVEKRLPAWRGRS